MGRTVAATEKGNNGDDGGNNDGVGCSEGDYHYQHIHQQLWSNLSITIKIRTACLVKKNCIIFDYYFLNKNSGL